MLLLEPCLVLHGAAGGGRMSACVYGGEGGCSVCTYLCV